jgi:hypothetical protein
MTHPCWWSRNLPNWYSVQVVPRQSDTYCKEHDILQSVLSSIQFMSVSSDHGRWKNETGATLSPSYGEQYSLTTELARLD